MSESKARRGWDDRRSPEDTYHRKRKSNDDHYRKDEGRSHHREFEGRRPRGNDENNRHRNHDDDRPHRGDDDRRDRSRSRDRGNNFRRNNDRGGRRSRFQQSFVKKEDASPEWGKPKVKEEKVPAQEKQKPNFETSGKLTEDANTVRGVVIKYSEPPDARKPKRIWRLYPFKGEKQLPVIYLHRQSAYLIGRDRKIADFPMDHPSVSKQHAAFQYRLVPFKRENGTEGKQIRLYLIDLDSANGTYVNNVKIEPRRYHQLLERDVVKFGFSSREFVLLHENSKDDTQDDDVIDEPAAEPAKPAQ